MTNFDLVSLYEHHYLQYHVMVILDNTHIIPALIDTGASWSHISRKYVNKSSLLTTPRTIINYYKEEITFVESTIISLYFDENVQYRLKIVVEEGNNHLLLGTDFLSQINYTLTKDYLVINQTQIERIKLSEEQIFEEIKRRYNGRQ